MSLGKKPLELRKKAGLSQEEAADQLNVSRQTVSKWETDQTVPDLTKVKFLYEMYHVSYGQLISGNTVGEDLTSMDNAADEIDWTAARSQKYPILVSYQGLNGVGLTGSRLWLCAAATKSNSARAKRTHS